MTQLQSLAQYNNQQAIPAISIRNLEFAYSNRSNTLSQLELKIDPGEKVGLIGPNGAGKTTLFLTICGILAPKSGTIDLFGKPVQPGEFRPEIGLVFQNPNDQLFCPTVRDDVAFGPENLGLDPQTVDQRVEQALKLTGVAHLAQRVPHHLSGGEKCMVAIATVLSLQPQLVLYDEPSANLDLQARRRLIDFLIASSETIFISSHDLELIIDVCDRVLLLNQGKILADGSPQEVMGDRHLMEANGLEVPLSLQPGRGQ